MEHTPSSEPERFNIQQPYKFILMFSEKKKKKTSVPESVDSFMHHHTKACFSTTKYPEGVWSFEKGGSAANPG